MTPIQKSACIDATCKAVPIVLSDRQRRAHVTAASATDETVLGDGVDRLTALWRDKQLQYTWLAVPPKGDTWISGKLRATVKTELARSGSNAIIDQYFS